MIVIRSFREETYGKWGLQGMATLLPDSEGGRTGQTAQLSPHTLPLQRVICPPDGELVVIDQTMDK